MENSKKSPHLIATNTDVVIEECNDVVEEEADITHLLSTEKTKGYVASRQLDDDSDYVFNQVSDGRSIHTTPSMFSLISMPFDNCTRINMVTVLSFSYRMTITFTAY